MIDEEDEEEILKKKVSLKKIFKNLLLVVLIIVGALFIYLGNGESQISNFFIGFSLICVGSTLIQIQKPPPEPIRQTLTILKCSICNLTKVRNYQHGDFVFKKEDSCENCKELMQINQIYSVKLKKPTVPPKKAPSIKV
ncbi:MAG: hypothetical protein ACFE85_07850 [Candidatus Hodarchaeota archaeon]